MDEQAVAQILERLDELTAQMDRLRASPWVWPAATGRLPACPTVDALPVADDLQAYRILTLRGLPDTMYQCLRDVGGTWTWVAVATAGAVAAINVREEGALIGTRNTLNFEAGDHIDLTVVDDGVNGRVTAEIAVDDTGLTTQSAFATHASRHEPGGADEVTNIAYTPGVPGDWSPAPDDLAEALDQLAARVAVLEP